MSSLLLRALMLHAPRASSTSLLPLHSVAIYVSYRSLLEQIERSCLADVRSQSDKQNGCACRNSSDHSCSCAAFWGGTTSFGGVTKPHVGDMASASILLDIVALTMLSSASIQSRAIPALLAAVEEFPLRGVCDAARVGNEVKPLCDWYLRRAARAGGAAIVNLRQRLVEDDDASSSAARGDDEAHVCKTKKKMDACNFEHRLGECRGLARLILVAGRSFLWGDVQFGRCKLHAIPTSRCALPTSAESTASSSSSCGVAVVNGNDHLSSLSRWSTSVSMSSSMSDGSSSAACCILLVDELVRFPSPKLSFAVVAVKSSREHHHADGGCLWRFFVVDALGRCNDERVTAMLLHRAAAAATGGAKCPLRVGVMHGSSPDAVSASDSEALLKAPSEQESSRPVDVIHINAALVEAFVGHHCDRMLMLLLFASSSSYCNGCSRAVQAN